MFEINLEKKGRTENYNLICDFNSELVDNIKKLTFDHREFNKKTNIWTLKAVGLYNLIKLYKGRDDVSFNFGDEKQKEAFIKIIEKHKKRVKEKKEIELKLISDNNLILDMKAKLPELANEIDYGKFLKQGIKPMQHQLEAALFSKYLIEKDKSVLLSMDLGTGKTLSAIIACELLSNIKKILFIVPANLKLNIQNEIHKFTNEKCYVLKTRKDNLVKYKRNQGYSIDECKYIVLNYEYFSSNKFDVNIKILQYGLNKVDLIIFDEIHMLSNKTSNRSFNIRKSFDKIVKSKIGLSATPLKNHIHQFFPLLKLLKPEEFSNENKFLTEICGMKYGIFGWELDPENPPKLSLLHDKLQTFTYRVLKKDVLKDLPELTINKILIEMTTTEEKVYKDIESGFSKVDWDKNELTKTDDNDSAIVILSRLRQFTASLKIKKALEIIKELNDMGEKVLLFDCFKNPLYLLKNELGDNSKIYSGDETVDQKQNLVDLFQNKNNVLMNLLISLQAGNAGITLTESSNIIQTTQSYLPSENLQAYSRSHRKGQLNAVSVYILIIVDSIDELIFRLVKEKEKIIDHVIDGIELTENIDESVLGDVIEELRRQYKK